MKVYHVTQDEKREVNNNAVDYGDGTIMVQYLDDNQVAIVPKSELVVEK
jgi:hypothetical protein